MLRRGQTTRRYLALAQCCLLTLALVGAHVHRATIRHGYCSDHGELIHPGEEEHGHQATPDDRAALIPKTHMEGTHGCAILEFLAQSITAGCSCSVVPRTLLIAAGAAVGYTADHASIPLLRQSPKHSPPHA